MLLGIYLIGSEHARRRILGAHYLLQRHGLAGEAIVGAIDCLPAPTSNQGEQLAALVKQVVVCTHADCNRASQVAISVRWAGTVER